MLDASSPRSLAVAPPPPRAVRERIFPVGRDMVLVAMTVIWGGYLAVMGLRIMLFSTPAPVVVLAQYLAITMLSVFFSWCLYRLLVFAESGRVAGPMLVLGVPAILFTLITTYVEIALFDARGSVNFSFAGSGGEALFDRIFLRYLLFAGFVGLYLSLLRHQTMKATLENNLTLQKLTRQSELRALRFQLNPHFVFNALNSVSSLIIEQKNQQAEKLVDRLADYMREVLKDDDAHFVTVAREMAQQVRYLEIEQVRFPNRLSFEVNIEDAVKEQMIPALILQPLIENAIKYGVARSVDRVRIEITVSREEKRLNIIVANDGRMLAAGSDRSGTGTGLANIRERLAATYGPAAALVTANSNDGMAVASIIIPADFRS